MSKYDFFLQESEKAYHSEEERRDRLTFKAEKYISAVAVVIGFRLIDLNSLSNPTDIKTNHYMFFSLLSFMFLGVSLIISLLSMRIQKYVSYPRGDKLIDKLFDENVSDEEAKKAYIHMYNKAHYINAAINDRKANLLFYSCMLLVIGFVIAVLSFLVEKGVIKL